MRYYHLKTFFLLAILSLYSSCGYEIPGKDKHPEIPEFNGFDKDLFVIDTLLTEVQLMGTEVQLMATDKVVYDSTDKFIYLRKGDEWFLLDKDFKIKQKINAKGYFGGNKTFYDKIEDKNKTIIYKYTYPWEKAEKVKELQYLDHDSIVKNYAIPKDENGAYDLEEVTKINKRYIDNQLGVIEKIIPVDFHSIVCIGSKGEYFTEDYKYNHYYEIEDTKTTSYSYLGDDKINDNLYEFDWVALGNHGGGNHFVFWFTPYGYRYYTFKIGNDSIQFKWNTKSSRQIIQLKDFWGDRVLIYKDGENGGELYSISSMKK